jgi:hypothetical protein
MRKDWSIIIIIYWNTVSELWDKLDCRKFSLNSEDQNHEKHWQRCVCFGRSKRERRKWEQVGILPTNIDHQCAMKYCASEFKPCNCTKLLTTSNSNTSFHNPNPARKMDVLLHFCVLYCVLLYKEKRYDATTSRPRVTAEFIVSSSKFWLVRGYRVQFLTPEETERKLSYTVVF